MQIRMAVGLSQNEIVRALGVDLTRDRISAYEIGKGEPPLPVLLAYARLVGVCPELLMDDELDLPAKLPAKRKHRP